MFFKVKVGEDEHKPRNDLKDASTDTREPLLNMAVALDLDQYAALAAQGFNAGSLPTSSKPEMGDLTSSFFQSHSPPGSKLIFH